MACCSVLLIPALLKYTSPNRVTRALALTLEERVMERIRFVTHRGHRILLVDYTNCTADEVAEIADDAPPIVTREPLGSVLLLADFSGAKFDRETVEHIKIAAAIDKRHLKRDAWV